MQSNRAEVERFENRPRGVFANPHERSDIRRRARANHVADCFARKRGVFAVDNREVETGQAENFYNLGTADFHERPEQKPLFAEF